jgi:hypothetical protein
LFLLAIGSNGQIIPQDALRYNDFGGTLGGPQVIPHLYNGRNKTFFFSWDESTLHLNGTTVLSVSTPAECQGDSSEDPDTELYGIWDPMTTVAPDAQGLFQRTATGTPAPRASRCSAMSNLDSIHEDTSIQRY